MKTFYRKRRSLLLSFWILTISVIILSVLSQILINNSLQDIKANVKLIDAANDQGTLSLQIMKQIAADKLEGKTIGLPLDSLIGNLKQIQQTILSAKIHVNSPFTTEYTKLDFAFTNFDSLLEIALVNNDNISFVSLMGRQEIYLKLLDKLVIDLDGYANNKINRFQLFQVLIMLVSLFIIGLEALFIVLPAIKRIKKQNEQLGKIAFEQSHIVRRPLANLLGLLHLIEISDNNESELEEVLKMIKSEAEELDNIIQKTVHFTYSGLENIEAQSLNSVEYII